MRHEWRWTRSRSPLRRELARFGLDAGRIPVGRRVADLGERARQRGASFIRGNGFGDARLEEHRRAARPDADARGAQVTGRHAAAGQLEPQRAAADPAQNVDRR